VLLVGVTLNVSTTSTLFGHNKLYGLPQKRFLRDLEKEILEWQAEGDTVILVADMNKDV